MKIQQAPDRKVIENKLFKQKANALKPKLNKKLHRPVSIVETFRDEYTMHGWASKFVESAKHLKMKNYGKSDSFILDFGTHHVGYFSMNINPVGSPPDAPLHLRLTFGA